MPRHSNGSCCADVMESCRWNPARRSPMTLRVSAHASSASAASILKEVLIVSHNNTLLMAPARIGCRELMKVDQRHDVIVRCFCIVFWSLESGNNSRQDGSAFFFFVCHLNIRSTSTWLHRSSWCHQWRQNQGLFSREITMSVNNAQCAKFIRIEIYQDCIAQFVIEKWGRSKIYMGERRKSLSSFSTKLGSFR